MNAPKLNGLIAATYTPFAADGSVNLALIPQITDYLIDQGINGLYVCGSTGEGVSLTTDERKRVAEHYLAAARQRVPVIIQVGHNSLETARELARHAQQIGADVVSANCPSYFKITDIETLLQFVEILAAAAPDKPFYYYHIPALTGSQINVVQFLQLAVERVPNLLGLKYTDTRLHEFQQCLDLHGKKLDCVWGCDEMLLGALATGATAAIGSTYNVAAPINLALIKAFQEGDLDTAQRYQMKSIRLINALYQFPFHPSMKWLLHSRGLPVGSCRLPHPALTEEHMQGLTQWLPNLERLAQAAIDSPTELSSQHHE